MAQNLPIDVPLNLESDPVFVIARAVDQDNQSSPAQSPITLPDWSVVLNGGKRFVRINNILGLTSGHTYSITLAIF